VLVKGSEIITSTKTGIAPMIDFLTEQKNMKGFSVADKIVGRAVALLFAKAEISEVYADVMSQSAVQILEKYNIKYSYNIITENIINRAGTGICPMEETASTIDNPDDAFVALKAKLEQMRTKHN
jgi:predicted transcriptional regulator